MKDSSLALKIVISMIVAPIVLALFIILFLFGGGLIQYFILSPLPLPGNNQINRSTRYDKIIVEAGRRNGVYPPLLKAVIWKESRFDASARGMKGGIGLMNIVPQVTVKDWENTFQRHVPSDGALMDPELNIEIGSWFLGRALNRWKDYNDYEVLALCEYNAGIQRAESWKPLLHDGKVMPNIDIESTRKYVKEILERRDKYEHEWKWEKLK